MTEITKYRKKPVEIEAVQFRRNGLAICEWAENTYVVPKGYEHAPAFLVIKTLEGNHRADEGDWIIRGVQGEFYPCKPDIFERTYERVAS